MKLGRIGMPPPYTTEGNRLQKAEKNYSLSLSLSLWLNKLNGLTDILYLHVPVQNLDLKKFHP